MDKTTNYNLIKPLDGEYYDIGVSNGNMDLIDAELKKGQDHRENINNPHGVTAAQVGSSNPNLLTNGDFKIWQKGTSFNSSGVYTADRWRVFADGTSFSVQQSGASMVVSRANGTYIDIAQYIELTRNIDNRYATLSAKIDGVIYSYTFMVGVQVSAIVSTNLKFLVGTGIHGIVNTGVCIQFLDTASHTIDWIKFEIGSVPTPFSPRSYAEELAMCRRYLRDLYGIYDMIQYSANGIGFAIHVDEMRATPTIVNNGAEVTDWSVQSRTAAVSTGFTFNPISDFAIQLVKNSHGLTDGTLKVTTKGKVFADAEMY